jgi:SAM-dependent methyltransferase
MEARPCPLCQTPDLRPYFTVRRHYGGHSWVLALARCPSCGFVFVPEPPAIAYDEHYLHEEGIITGQDPLEQARVEGRLNAIARRVPPGPQVRLLDFGIGDGHFLAQAAARGYLPYGYDINPAGFALARELYGLTAEFSSAPLAEAFPATLFDIIHLNEVIEYLAEPLVVLRWCADHLRPGGLLVVQTGNIRSLAARIMGRRWIYIRPAHVSYFSHRTLAFALQQVGLRPLSQRSIDWSVAQALRATRAVIRQGRWRDGLHFLAVTLTGKIPNVRRGVVIDAVR